MEHTLNLREDENKNSIKKNLLKITVAVVAAFLVTSGISFANDLLEGSIEEAEEYFSLVGNVEKVESTYLRLNSSDSKINTKHIEVVQTNEYKTILISSIEEGDQIIVQGVTDGKFYFAQRIISFSADKDDVIENEETQETSSSTEETSTTTEEISTSTDETLDDVESNGGNGDGSSDFGDQTSTTTEEVSTSTDETSTSTSTSIKDISTGTTTNETSTTTEETPINESEGGEGELSTTNDIVEEETDSEITQEEPETEQVQEETGQ